MEVSISRFQEIDGYTNHKTHTYTNITHLEEKAYEVAIIATNADVRYDLTNQLVDNFAISYIIFEKVVFQSEKQFESIIEKLDKKNIRSWVNCPRRSINYYQQLKKELKNNGPIHLEVEGVDWGLACNSIHQIDLLAFLTEELDYSIIDNQILPEIFESKRLGFIEFYGSYSGISNSGNQYTLICNQKTNQDDKPAIKLKITSKTLTIKINESIGKAEFYKNGEIKPYKIDTFHMNFQSELTGHLVSQIISDGICSLTPLNDSYLLHKPFLNLFLNLFNRLKGIKMEKLPIT